ncbi:MAG: class I SAM-dependent RNA methyltransferase [Chitinophagaceae bacterium]|nr:class I SAM-dependent RNA methyltransferase [Oligoflexus sp.]
MIKKNLDPAKKLLPPLVVAVTDVAFGGDGIARTDGKVIFVEHAVPGETVEATVLQDKKRFIRARTTRLLEPAPDAIKAFCPVFGTCGGCDWQHVPYPKQLGWKADFIRSALFKNARYEHFEAIRVLPSTRIRDYRNRIKLKARLTPKQTLEFGYFAKSSHNPVFIESCPIADPQINTFLATLKNFRFRKAASWQGDMEIQALPTQRLIHFMPELPREALSELRRVFPDDAFEATNPVPFEVDQGIRYATQTAQFQQVNLEGNHQLRQWIYDKVIAIEAKTVLDLFCGSGNLSLQLVSPITRVWGMELAGKAVETAAFNLKANGLSNATYKNGPVRELKAIFSDLPKAIDCIITDPPRQGMDDSLEEILRLRPKHILSVSCDPNTFARDLKLILEQGYEVKELFGIDFFPHTYHVETVAHISRLGPA